VVRNSAKNRAWTQPSKAAAVRKRNGRRKKNFFLQTRGAVVASRELLEFDEHLSTTSRGKKSVRGPKEKSDTAEESKTGHKYSPGAVVGERSG